MTEEPHSNPEACRSWWRNCAVATDDEILAIDRLEDAISPLPSGASRTRELISTLELCHHKAERWLANIVSAIASGDTEKGLGTRPAGATHPVERTWKSACAVLSGWCAGCPVGSVDLSVGERPEIVLGVIGGDPNPPRPFAFCARNIKLSPLRERIKTVSHTLQVFCKDRPPDDDVDAELLASLGEPSRQGQWLAASLGKTVRLQMDL
jgi:hypothetical protein